jgi:hypothetical protein
MDFIGSHNISETIACHIEPHPLPRHPGKGVHVKQIPVGHIDRLFKLAGDDTPDGEKARLELIQRSIVNQDGSPLFPSEDAAKALIEGNQPIFLDLIDVIGKANNKKPNQIDKEADAAEKK